MPSQIKRIAMWASPRCLSTVLLRSWGSRSDTFVHDEPLYPHYLLVSNRQDPGREDVLRQYETDWQKIAERVTTGSIPFGKSIYYQKFMVYRLMPHIDTDWIYKLENCFLIREPHEMLLSYLRLWPNPTMNTIGLQRLKQLFEQISQQRGSYPPVIDAGDLRQNPRQTLKLLCQALDVEFTEAMLQWSPGNPTDDLWSQYDWYDTARNSTTFRPYRLTRETLPDEFRPLLEQCQQIYNELYTYRLVAS
jgi:hypothetical protein